MSSSVHFRFKSAREFETLSFEGDFLKVADLKVAIVERKKLNFGEGFDLEISDASTGDVFNDESALVQKNTSVIVRRVPGLRQGGILSHQEMAAKNERYAEKQGNKPKQTTGTASDQNAVLPKAIEGSDEAERIASLVMQSNVQYDQYPPPVRGRYPNRSNNRGRGGNFGSTRNAHSQSSFPNASHSSSAYPDRAPRPSSNYVCHRCNRPGHWIDQCPTNGDPTYDRIKVRAPTGIPRSMLRQVDAPESGTGLQDSSGHFVTLQPNEEEFARQTVGLRLSQAAATSVDKDADSNAGARDGDGAVEADEKRKSNIRAQQASQDDVDKNIKPALTNGHQEVRDYSQEAKEQRAEGTKEGATDPSNRDSAQREVLQERSGDHHSCEIATTPSEENRFKNQGKKSSLSSRIRQSQPSQRVGGTTHIPIAPIPPGFPPLGMPPIPPGMPPIPPHILMAMAMTNRQNVRPPHLPQGMHPGVPMPFTTSTPSSIDEKKQDVITDTQKVASEEQQLTADAANPNDIDGKRMNGEREPSPKSRRPRQEVGGNEGDAREDDGPDQQGVDHPSCEMIDSAFKSKADAHASRALRLDRGDTRTPKQRSFYENENESRNEYRGSRAELPVMKSYRRKDSNYRSRSPSLRVPSSSGEGSPRRRERRDREEEAYLSPSPKRRASEKGPEDRHTHSSRRGERNKRYRSSEYREGVPQDDTLGDPRRGLYSRRPSQSPSRRGRHGMNGTLSPDFSTRRSRSPEKRSRYSSPSHRFRGNSSRRWHGKESPDRRFRRSSPIERQFRSTTPPRSARYASRVPEDMHLRQQGLSGSKRSPSAEKDRDPGLPRVPDENGSRYELADRTRPKISGSEKDERGPRPAPEDFRPYPAESRKRAQDVTEKSSQDSADERQPQRGMPRGNRRKREFDRRPVPQGELKRPRREHAEERNSVYHQESRDRPSVHDRLGGRPGETRRRKRQRRSVHDRLG